MNVSAMTESRLTRRRRRLPILFVGVVLVLGGIAVAVPFGTLANTFEHAGDYLIYVRNDGSRNEVDSKHVQVSGSNNVFFGDVHANGDFHASGQNNSFNDDVTYV